MSDKTRRTVTLDEENDAWLAEQDNASALLNDLVTQARISGNRGTAAIDLQIQQKERRRENAEERVENLDQDIEELYTLKREMNSEEESDLERARDVLSDVPRDPSNPGIKNWAEKLDMTPVELVEELD